MVLNAEAKFRKRAREALKEGRDFEARGETNKRILEEVRAELEEEASPPPGHCEGSGHRGGRCDGHGERGRRCEGPGH